MNAVKSCKAILEAVETSEATKLISRKDTVVICQFAVVAVARTDISVHAAAVVTFPRVTGNADATSVTIAIISGIKVEV